MTSCTRFLAACALATFAANARAADDDSKDVKIPLTLAEVRAFPEAYTKVPFEIALLYHGPRDVYNPFYTVFEPSSFLNFAAWTADAPVFSREGFCDDYPLFYVDRRAQSLQTAIVAMRPFTWFNARCIVRSTAQNHAWIEVIAITQIGPIMDPGDLRHLVRANVLSANGEFERALLEFEMARLVGAPPKFIARCRGEEGRVALSANQPERAAMALEQAFQWFPEDKQVATLLDKATSQIASTRQRDVASVPWREPPPLHKHPTPVVPTRTPNVDPQAPTPIEPEPTPVEEPSAPVEEPSAEPTEEPASDEGTEAPADETQPTEGEEPSDGAAPADDGTTPEVAPDEPSTEPAADPNGDEVPTPADDGTAPSDGVTPADDGSEPQPDATEPTPSEEPAPDSTEPSEEPADGTVPQESDEPADAPADPDAAPADPDATPEVAPDGEPSEDPDATPDDGTTPDEPTTPPDGHDGDHR